MCIVKRSTVDRYRASLDGGPTDRAAFWGYWWITANPGKRFWRVRDRR